ncbi:hypothetical protein FC093_08120 [Ilyomonas limi]|uniref:Uncharacterized protein n=1 Tax=Ilyomonas limi TaxID=2575867 RepID=A0A4U3L2M1_9BACT|nr:hypothetical protein [Ilyomonas limi]TKK69275.1 hypothetical protein FC093_08120 [Ilyomonas limi]
MQRAILIQLLGFFITLSLFSCTRNGTVMLPATRVEITVKDGNSWAAFNTAIDVVSGAIVKLYDSESDIMSNKAPEYTAITNGALTASILVEYKSEYFFTVEKGNAANTINGLLKKGIFQTQAQIDASPVQIPAPIIGSPKFLDTNGDGIITPPLLMRYLLITLR